MTEKPSPTVSTNPAPTATHERTSPSITDEASGSLVPPAPLACLQCRQKRVKCDHVKPICGACEKAAELNCEWPSGRKRRRTKREMERLKVGETPSISSENQQIPLTNDISSDSWLSFLNTPPHPSLSQPITEPIPSMSNDSIQVPQQETNFSSWESIPDFLQLGAVLHAQAPTVLGVPGDEENLEVYYYRFSGSTSMKPGVNRVNLRLRKRKPESPFNDVPHAASPTSPPVLLRPLNDMFDEEDMPYPHIREPLFELFFKHLSQHFPSVSRQRMNERFESGTMSQFLANSVCAISARFSPSNLENPTQACAPFMSKAQTMLVPMMQLPSGETTSGLILLAWASYGQGSDTGLWQLSGMAIRMALDVGIHKISEIYESPQHLMRVRLLFWTLFVTDRLIAFSEGRETMINDDIIEIPLPENSDFFPDPARNTSDYPFELVVEPVPFVYFVRLMVIVGRISNVLNGRRGKPRTLVPTLDAERQSKVLAELQVRLIEFVANLPESLRWNLDNLKHQQSRGHSGTLLALHLYCHAVLAMTYHPDLLKSPSGQETPLNRNMLRDMRLALESSKLISECIPLADLLDPSSYITIPYLIQPLSIGVSSLVQEIKGIEMSDNIRPDPTTALRMNIAREKVTVLLKAMSKVVQAWAAGRPALDILKKRAGLSRPDDHPNREVFVSLPDSGMVRRFQASKDHPQNIAQPTETSLRESIQRQNASLNPLWLTNLMMDYTLEGMSFDPVENADLYRLVSGDGDSHLVDGPI